MYSRTVLRAIVISIGWLSAHGAPAAAPATVYWDGRHMSQVRESLDQAPRAAVTQAIRELRQDADEALDGRRYSVMNKRDVPPSGDKHDYLSHSRYWWPNPETQDGLPYVRRDGEVNHQLLARGDRHEIGNFYDDVESLTLAYFFLGERRYGARAVALIDAWFLDPATRMNPHLNYGQAVPGRAEGRGVGIIDTRHFLRVLDCISILNATKMLTEDQDRRLRAWFTAYLMWLQTSPLGQEEREAENNHGTWYDAQLARIAIYVGKDEVARRVVEAAKRQRIAMAIRADGSQPKELARTRSLHYCFFNLSALGVLARVGEKVGVDLWGYQAPNGASIKVAIENVFPYLDGRKRWEHQQIVPFQLSPRGTPLLVLAAERYQTQAYRDVVARIPKSHEDHDFTILLFP